MALAFTEKIELGYKAPTFNLPEPLTGFNRTVEELKGELATVVVFICNHCPYVKHINEGLVKLANDYISKGIAFIAISSNDADKYPKDGPDKMALIAEEFKYPFPYLYDESQEVAKAYHAVCTPDFSVFNADLKCVYRGQLDDSRPNSGIPVTGKDMRAVFDAIIVGKDISQIQVPSAGCSIKWK